MTPVMRTHSAEEFQPRWVAFTKAHGLSPHQHAVVPFTEPATHRYAATHHETSDIARVWVDWKRVAYEQWTGRRQVPAQGEQLTFRELARG